MHGKSLDARKDHSSGYIMRKDVRKSIEIHQN